MEKYGERIILNVPYKEKEHAKQLGAWWDPDIKKWFVPKGTDPRPFIQWFVDRRSSVETNRVVD